MVRIELRARRRPDPLLTVQALLEVLARAATNEPTLVIFDEFSGISGVDGAAGLLRTHLQHHYQQIGLVFAGSEPSMMRTLFNDQAQPFYAQADLVEIGPLTAVEVADTVTHGFTSTGRDAANLPMQIIAFANGHPQRSMQLADTGWRLVEPGNAATTDTWDRTLEAVRAASANGNERLYSGLSDGEKSVLRIISSGGSVFGAAADVLDLPHGTAQHARRKLTDRGHLSADADRSHTVVDPVLADWIAHRFPL